MHAEGILDIRHAFFPVELCLGRRLTMTLEQVENGTLNDLSQCLCKEKRLIVSAMSLMTRVQRHRHQELRVMQFGKTIPRKAQKLRKRYSEGLPPRVFKSIDSAGN